MKLSELKTTEEVLDQDLRDPAFRAEWERTAVANAVALKLIAYRAERGLSQTALARMLGMKQPQVSRLEQGDVTPSIETLSRISQKLGMEIVLDFHPSGSQPRLLNKRALTDNALISRDSGTSALAVAAT